MSRILNIETSSKTCSVALTADGMVEYHVESDGEMEHAVKLGRYVSQALDEIARREMELDAVAVSAGPGSYTGLRIGMSMAKGICFAREIPLIAVPTLEVLAVKAMFGLREPEGDEILIPMIDARRMEVYTAAYDFRLQPLLEPQAIILDENSFADLLADHRCVFIGDGSAKARQLIKSPNAIFLSASDPLAMDMTALSEKFYREGRFADTAYATPFYLKEANAVKSKNKVLCNNQTTY